MLKKITKNIFVFFVAVAWLLAAFAWMAKEAVTLSLAYAVSWLALTACAVILLLELLKYIKSYLKKDRIKSPIYKMCLLLLSVVFFSIFITQSRPIYHKEICSIKIRNLSFAIVDYWRDNGRYPVASQWCDVLMENAKNKPSRYTASFVGNFTCPAVREGECNFAMNPNATPDSPPNTVLLFESIAGWNTFGGSEMVTFENHNGQGCNVLLNNHIIKYVNKKEFNELKW